MEKELEEQFKKEFKDFYGRDGHIAFVFTRLEAWVLFSQLHLALRHPGNKGPSAEIARKLAHRIQEKVAPSGAMAEVAKMGWREEYDI